MMIDWQECVVGLVLLLCGAYTVHRILKRKSGCCNCPLHHRCGSQQHTEREK